MMQTYKRLPVHVCDGRGLLYLYDAGEGRQYLDFLAGGLGS